MSESTVQKVLLMSLPAVMEIGLAENKYNADHAFNLGLAYLAAVLRQDGLSVTILDCLAEDRNHVRATDGCWQEVGLPDTDIFSHIRECSPDLIAISIPFSNQHKLSTALIRQIKELFPHIILVAGGNHVSAVPDKVLTTAIDYLIIGEGEWALSQLIQALNRGELMPQIPGVASKHSLTFPRTPFIKHPDELPFPAIDLLPVKKLWGSGRRWINMIATRGCVYDCNFCAIHTIMGYPIRRRSVENVIAEIKHWRQVFRVQEIFFEDDNLTTNKQWAKELFRQIAAEKFGIRFHVRNGIRADSIDRELLTLMKAAGFFDFWIAPESGSQETLDKIIGKKMKLEDCTNAVKLAQEVGIGVNAFFVMGFPQENWEDLETTVNHARYLKSLGTEGFWFSVAAPYPGTRLYDQCLEQGYITEEFDYRRLRVADSVIKNENFSDAQLKAFRNQAMVELSPPVLSFPAKSVKHLDLLVHNPSLFMAKFRSKFGIS